MVKKALNDIKGVGPSMVKKLRVAGIKTLADLANQSSEELSLIDGVGLKTAQNWIAEATKLLDGAHTEKQTEVEGQIKKTVQKPKKEVESDSNEKNQAYSQVITETIDNLLEKLELDIQKIFERMDNIEGRLEVLERGKLQRFGKDKKLITTMMNHPFIRNEDALLEVTKEKIGEMRASSPNIQNIFISDLYRQIIKDYSITREIFAEYLLMLFRENKIQLEPSLTDEGFAVRDVDGAVYKIVRILE